MHDLGGDDFAFLARLLRRRSGLVLTPDKTGLFDRRISPVLYRFGFKDLGQLVRELRLGNDSLAAATAEAMTVNETCFFRDAGQSEALRATVLPQLLAARAGAKRLRVWSAACAAGQEAYSIAMLLDELGVGDDGWTIDLIATDLSGEAVSRAAQGHYNAFEVQRGISLEQLSDYFVSDADGGFTICDRLRRMVSFRRFNLLDSFGWLDDLDIVFCRNVLIYFDRATKLSILERIADNLAEDGVLFLGDAEAPQAAASAFSELPGHAGVFVKKQASARLTA